MRVAVQFFFFKSLKMTNRNIENYFTQYGVSTAMLKVSRAAATRVAMVTLSDMLTAAKERDVALCPPVNVRGRKETGRVTDGQSVIW